MLYLVDNRNGLILLGSNIIFVQKFTNNILGGHMYGPQYSSHRYTVGTSVVLWSLANIQASWCEVGQPSTKSAKSEMVQSLWINFVQCRSFQEFLTARDILLWSSSTRQECLSWVFFLCACKQVNIFLSHMFSIHIIVDKEEE